MWLPLLVLAAALGFLQAPLAAAAEPVIEPAEYAGAFSWRPSTAAVGPGGAVAFRNPGKIVPHGIAWMQGPATPSCGGVPVNGSGTDWSGSCTFAQAGTYAFVCTVHPEEMKGTVTVGAGEPPPAPPAGYGPSPEGSEGRAFKTLRLAKNQQGGAIRGSLVVSQEAAGGRLAVELSARRASLGAEGNGVARVGQLAKSRVQAGRLPFEVTLRASARRALRERGRLSVSVEIVLRPPHGPKATASRKVELRG
jgi:plastocyanin